MDSFERWITFAGPSRAGLLEPLRERLADPIAPPEDAAELIDPLRRLVCMGTIPRLGKPFRRIAEDFAGRYGFDGDCTDASGNIGEPEALTIHLATAGLIEPRGAGYRPSKVCGLAARHPVRLWELVADSLLTSYYVFGSQPELAIAGMARRTIEGDIGRALKDALLEALVIEQRPESAERALELLGSASAITSTVCRGLRMVPPDSHGVGSALLTPGGLHTALRALRAAALSDDRYMWALEEAGVAARN